MDNSIRKQFVPNRMLDILQIDGSGAVAEENMKKTRRFDATVIRMGLPDADAALDGELAVQVFEKIAERVERAMPSFIEWGGVVDRFVGGDGVQVLFMDKTGSPRSSLSAVGAAVQARENMLKSGDMWKDMTFGMSFGTVNMGVLGGMGHYTVMSMSAESAIAGFLRKSAVKYSASILATERLLEHDPTIISKYTNRLLGKFYFSGINKALKIYDFYDGDEIAVRTAKRKTALLFDKGVSFFLEGDFVQARSYFIEVLKANRTDKAARVYLSLCDNFRDNPPETPEALCIERV